MRQFVKSAVVIGSGIMGSGIAAHLANVGISTCMLDVVPRNLTQEEKQKGLTIKDKQVRNRLTEASKKALVKQKPSPITSKKILSNIRCGNLEDDVHEITQADWIIEVVVENLEIKKQILTTVDKHRKKESIVSSNTSGISLEKMIEDCSDDLKRRFLGTHFFNPPRYLKLLEITPTVWTKPEILSYMKKFFENVLGKGVVEAKDTPNFIANRIGTYGLLITVKEMKRHNMSIGEVDSITGPLIGRPKSATFRTLDIVGIDTFIRVANNVYHQVEGKEKEDFNIPVFMQKMVEQRLLGEKTKQGFYQKGKQGGKTVISELNYETFEYQKRKSLVTKSTELAKREKGFQRKMKTLLSVDGDVASIFTWAILKPVLLYAAEQVEHIANNLVSIDKAMRWGFGWEKGPFEIWDALGLQETAQRMIEEGEKLPSWVSDMITNNYGSFYKEENGIQYYYHDQTYKQLEHNRKEISLQLMKEEKGVIKKNSGASLIDLNDGVALLEFHSKSNAIGMDIIQMIHHALEEVNQNYDGLVIGNQGKNFCVGANLAMMLMEAQDSNFFEIELVVKQFQKAMMAIKYAEKPVVVAPFGMTLGGGAEVSLQASIQASLETYIGLVEVGVGLIPGGGGNKELYLKQIRDLPAGVSLDLQKITNNVFETIAMAKVSTSAHEAMELGFIKKHDSITVNQSHLIYEAKQKVISLSKAGYIPPKTEKIPVVGEPGYASMLLGAKSLAYGGFASEHDVKIAEKLAYVLAGGRIRAGELVDEQYLLDLEREAFLSLIGEPKTQQRMQHMLIKGKALRN